MKALIAQLDPAPGDIGRNLATVSETIDRNPHVDLVAFSELFLSGYDLDESERRSVPAGAAEFKPLARVCAAHETALIVGFAERLDGGVANSALVVDADGTAAGIVRKAHLFAGERDVFEAGQAIRPVELLGTSVGVMICFDVEFPEAARTLASLGARLLVTVSANMEPFAADHDLFARARAKENGLPHLYVNRVGEEYGFTFTGRSCNVSAHGDVLDQLDAGPALCEVAITLEDRRWDPRLDYRGQLRPDLYVISGEGVEVSR